MKIWVDADACPGAVKEIIVRAADRLAIETIFVANKIITLPGSPYLSFIRVPLGPDVVDQYIVEHSEDTDLVVTQDIPLAALLVPRGLCVMTPRGELFTENNIGERLSVRNFLQDMRDNGGSTGGPSQFGEKEKRQFANTFDKAITKLRKV